MTKNLIRITISITLMFLGLISCLKEKQNDDALADVYIKSILVNSNTAYGVSHIVRGLAEMESVIVTLPDGSTEPLAAADETKLVYYIDPSTGNGTMFLTPPSAGTYTYTVTFSDGKVKTYTDALSGFYLPPATITSLTKTTDGQNVQMAFNALTGVDYFQISIYLADVLQYTSPLQAPPSGNNFVIPISVISSFVSGTYKFELDAVKYESTETGQLQALSIATANVDL